jgi:hypothetical protein
MRRADIVRMIRALQLALALTPLVALAPIRHGHARGLACLRRPFRRAVTQPLHVDGARSSLDNETGFRCAR